MGISRENFGTLVKGMKAVYPQPMFIPDSDAFNVWYSLLQDIPYEVLSAAVQKHMSTNKFMPTVAEIRQLCVDVTSGGVKDFGDGWEQVLRAIRLYGMYQQAEALESMDEITRQCVNRLGWKELCTSEQQDHDRANFRMLYEQLQKRQRDEKQLSVNLQNRIDMIRDKHKPIEIQQKQNLQIETEYVPDDAPEQLDELISRLARKLTK